MSHISSFCMCIHGSRFAGLRVLKLGSPEAQQVGRHHWASVLEATCCMLCVFEAQ